MTHLITGATGEVGSRVVHHLLKRGIRPRVLVRNESKARLLFGERVDIFVGDLAEPAWIRDALKGADTLYLVNVGPEIPQRDEAAASLAKQAGVKRIVKLSSLDVEQGLAIGAWHEKGESAIRAIGIPFTFVRPTSFMSNLLVWAHSIRTESIVRSSTADGRRPVIHSEDIAAVSIEALVGEDYVGQSLPITGPSSLTFGEATAVIAEAIGQPLKFQPITDEEARGTLLKGQRLSRGDRGPRCIVESHSRGPPRGHYARGRAHSRTSTYRPHAVGFRERRSISKLTLLSSGNRYSRARVGKGLAFAASLLSHMSPNLPLSSGDDRDLLIERLSSIPRTIALDYRVQS